ncbi:MAG: glycoside hydrolase family 2 protein [Christensenellales bacterium]
MKIECLNQNWGFFKDVHTLEDLKTATKCVKVDLPHTWNNFDGQDGGGDYYRAKCFYKKNVTLTKRGDKDYYLEFRGVNSIADVYVNGEHAAHHEGGFSTFRANVTDLLVDGLNEIAVSADNSANDRVYPQMADFTFFGGIYRDVYMIMANKSRFDLDYLGGPGVEVTPIYKDGKATVTVRSYITNPQDLKVEYVVSYEGEEVAKDVASANDATATFVIDNPHLWDGVESPALYTLRATLKDGEGEIADEREVTFGVRSYEINGEGFWLNGRKYPLHGVSRHQDRLDMGWAITQKEHEEDMALIREVGANTIRLAHYQHDQYFYDLCDKNGMVVWAEIPYISSHLANGNENALSQMKELIVQNYNHPSIVCWGLSNEITIAGECDALYDLHHALNDLCHEMDKTRPTTMANVTMLDPDSEISKLSDVMSYNHYFGWYVGDVQGNAEWLDDFRQKYPQRAIGLSEYGCEGILKWHSSNPKQGDYTEEYQAYYHENMLKIFAERPYLWATHVWNMFDFGVDARNEGGVAGRNNKGLVTYDRKTKKDSFYIYKAYWTSEPFVHITSKRYEKRNERVTKVKVYSNQNSVTLYANGKEVGTQEGKYVFEFEVALPRFGKVRLKAVANDSVDESVVRYVAKPCKEYALKQDEKKEVGNWFEKNGVKYEFKYPEGYFSIKDKLNAIMATEEGDAFVKKIIEKVVEMMGNGDGSFKISPSLFKLVGGMTIERIASMAGDKLTDEMLWQVNEELNKIKKP